MFPYLYAFTTKNAIEPSPWLHESYESCGSFLDGSLRFHPCRAELRIPELAFPIPTGETILHLT